MREWIIALLCVSLFGSATEMVAQDNDRGGPAQTLRLEQERIISGYDVQFGRVGAVLADDSGTIYVLDELRSDIAVINGAGRLANRIGRKGDGPGEFSDLVDIGWHGDHLAALDARHRRISLFDRGGALIAARPWPSDAGWPHRLMSGRNGVYGVGHLVRPAVQVEEQVFRSPQPFLAYVSLNDEGAVEVLEFESDTASTPRGFQCRGERVIEGFPPFFPAGPLRAVSGSDRLAIAESAEFALTFVDVRSGEQLGRFKQDRRAHPVGDEEWERVTEEFREKARTSGPWDCVLATMRPEVRPVVRSIVADDRGRLWLEVSHEDGYALTLLDPTGNPTAEALLPPRDPRVPMYVRGDHLYLVSEDGYGVQSIEVYRIHLG